MENEIAIVKKRAGYVPLNKRVWRRIRTPLAKSRFAANALAFAIGAYLRFVYRTNRVVDFDVAHADWLIENKAPMIATCWHGQHFMCPYFTWRGHPSVAMVSRSRDAELNARILERLGYETVRASGGRSASRIHEKGALRGILAMRKHLREGKTAFMVADVPHGTPRQVGMGVIAMARFSGTPILPVAYASSRRHLFEKSWDKAVLSLPFGRQAFLLGEPIEVPADADDATMENKRRELQESLNRLLDEAYAKVDAPA